MSEKYPMKRQAGQDISEMAEQLEASKKGSRLYPEVAEDTRKQAISDSIINAKQLLDTLKKRGKVDFNNFDEVDLSVDRYMEACESKGLVPDVMGFAASCGTSRQNLYEYLRTHNNKTTEYLEAVFSAWASILMQAGLSRKCSEPVSIFALKNAGQGLSDRTEVTFAVNNDPLGETADTEELKRKYLEDTYGYTDISDTEEY